MPRSCGARSRSPRPMAEPGQGPAPSITQSAAARRTIALLARAVTNYLYVGGTRDFDAFRAASFYDLDGARWAIERASQPMSLLTELQLEIIRRSIAYIHERDIPGDLLEAGVWRGGAVIFMRGVLEAYEMTARQVVAADSFAGIPLNTRATGDPVDQWADRWIASQDEVRANIARFGLLDERIEFCAGFFEQSLPALADRRFALIRLDSDSYDSVATSLEHLYPLVSKGGITIIDDWHLPGCRQAVEEYRARHRIADPIQEVGGNAYWAKRREHGEV